TLGRTFTYELLKAVSHLDELVVWRSLVQLVEAEVLYQRGELPHATYTFKHALLQEAAYQSLLRSTRQQYHQRIAQVLATQFLETAETHPELLAHHYTEAGLTAEAISYWQRAGQRALARSANVEAIGHLTKGLELLRTLPDTPTLAAHELQLLTTLGPALMATQGYGAPEVEHTYARAWALCQQVEETPQLVQVVFGLFAFYLVRAEYHTAMELAEQFLSLAHRVQDSGLLLVAHSNLAQTAFCLGELARARVLFEQGLAYYDPQQHRALILRYAQDPAVASLSWLAWCLWLLGYPDQGEQKIHAVLTLAQEQNHSLTLGSVLAWASHFYVFRRDGSAAYTHAEAAVQLSTEQGLPFRAAQGMMLRGWALASMGAVEEGIVQLRQGLEGWRTTGAAISLPYFLGLLADVCVRGAQVQEGLAVLAEALAYVDKTGERYAEAELHRLKGELLLSQAPPDSAQAEGCFRHALTIAQRQQAKSWELRAAVSLSRLWQRQGKRAEAGALLAPIYGWFTEGFDTADLQEAKVLLEALT
ncbi:MAG TPA: adenylate cyclase, partial [Candidatus Saccharimonadia bacterium]|nr:adenylate cyclase [Candidatus Saccharimonadia bacterium]